jgi:CRP-like cAMP-binding protein
MGGLALKIDRPPLSCGECRIARFAIYRPTVADSPQKVCHLRKEVRATPAGRTLVREGEVPDFLYVLYSGWAICYRQRGDGRRHIASFLVPGDTVLLEAVCFPNLPAPFSVKTLTDVSSCGFATNDMVELVHGSVSQRQELARARHQLLNFMHGRLFDLGRRSARGRLAQLVLDIRDRLAVREMVAADNSFAFPPRQEHLADALGLTTVYVNRTLGQLRREGVFSIEQERLTIQDEHALQRIAQEE